MYTGGRSIVGTSARSHASGGLSTALSLDQQLVRFLSSHSLTDDKRHKMEVAIQDLASLLKRTYSNGILIPFGSFVTGLGDETSDVDLAFDAFGSSGMNSHAIKFSATGLTVYPAVSKILKDSTSNFSGIEEVSSARFPLIRALHTRTGVRMDLSFEGTLGQRKSELISLYVKWSPFVRPLILILRQWGKSKGLLGSRKIKNYALTLLVFVFLTRRKMIPSIYWIQERSEPLLVDGNWNAGFRKDVNDLKRRWGQENKYNVESPTVDANAVLTLCQEMFAFYGTLDYSGNVISTLTSELIPKNAFDRMDSLPSEQGAYKRWIAGKGYTRKHKLYCARPMCIQDPIDLSHNVADVVQHLDLHEFKESCMKTSKEIMSIQRASARGQNPLFADMFV